MRTLEQLGISPAPWKVIDDLTSYPASVQHIKCDYWDVAKDCQPADARLIAAAPECCEALRLLLETLDGCGFQPILEGDPLAVAVRCGQAALAKAGGEIGGAQ